MATMAVMATAINILGSSTGGQYTALLHRRLGPSQHWQEPTLAEVSKGDPGTLKSVAHAQSDM